MGRRQRLGRRRTRPRRPSPHRRDEMTLWQQPDGRITSAATDNISPRGECHPVDFNAELAILRAEVARLKDECDFMKVCGVIELMVRNPNIDSFVKEKEARIEQLEQDLLYNSEEYSLSGVVNKIEKAKNNLYYTGEDDPAQLYTKKQLKEDIQFLNRIIEEAERYVIGVKQSRAPRKKKIVPVDKKLKTFKYQKEDKDFKISSVDPSKIIGAQEIWTFNTKYKIITVIRTN
jgi:hypothetical protein